MPYISVWVKPETLHILSRVSVTRGVSVEHIAEEVVESEAVSHLPGGRANMHFGPRERYTLSSGGIIAAEFDDFRDLEVKVTP